MIQKRGFKAMLDFQALRFILKIEQKKQKYQKKRKTEANFKNTHCAHAK